MARMARLRRRDDGADGDERCGRCGRSDDGAPCDGAGGRLLPVEGKLPSLDGAVNG
jgi:hypothetical protein